VVGEGGKWGEGRRANGKLERRESGEGGSGVMAKRGVGGKLQGRTEG